MVFEMDELNSIKLTYDRDYSLRYDSISQDPTMNHAQYFSHVTTLFEKNLWGTGDVLDIGCGTGLLKEMLLGNFKFTGVDLSKDMLKIAASRGYRVYEGAVQESLYEFKENQFDFVFAMSLLYHIDDVSEIIERFRAIARKAVIFTLEDIPECFEKATWETHQFHIYNHFSLPFDNAHLDMTLGGWQSPSRKENYVPRMRLVCLTAE